MKYFHYLTNCVEANGAAITAMVDAAKEISFATFIRHCDASKWAKDQGYADDTAQGKRHKLFFLENDRYVKYYQSTFQGKECYYLVHSAIEYIWVKHEHNTFKPSQEFQYVQDSIELEP